ncbi:hypothetical protein HRM2_44410 [Desulforapulum autotrophicum HRM2]|uniref:Uncharacterized protein n=1 Tax=Desulforapulum autotrophicum (strain ATCC 43914 / DSM 3382 / VKM B-1955 / HRM2) TaxID=177437 RepID=C0QEZ6_DESAH|nr:hypothetical protein [Desulforapulum autotrophicum]ACN17497.1 hypothetical protein HRM2_44410 [Desulforapulum autotrophicum HRM2]
MKNTAISLTDLIRKSKKHLSLLGYAKGTKNHYCRIWEHFLKYADQKGYNGPHNLNQLLRDTTSAKARFKFIPEQEVHEKELQRKT